MNSISSRSLVTVSLVALGASGILALSAFSPTPALAQNQLENLTPAFTGINTGRDPKHTPKITAPKSVKAGEWFDVTIEVGVDKRHPSLSTHAVRYIALYRDDVEIARTYLHPVYSSPKVTYTIALEKSVTLRAVEEPNHTGPWTSEFKVTVEPAAVAPEGQGEDK